MAVSVAVARHGDKRSAERIPPKLSRIVGDRSVAAEGGEKVSTFFTLAAPPAKDLDGKRLNLRKLAIDGTSFATDRDGAWLNVFVLHSTEVEVI
jgi:hypothetical protein